MHVTKCPRFGLLLRAGLAFHAALSSATWTVAQGQHHTETFDQNMIQGRTRRRSAFAFGEVVVSRMISSGGTANSTG